MLYTDPGRVKPDSNELKSRFSKYSEGIKIKHNVDIDLSVNGDAQNPFA